MARSSHDVTCCGLVWRRAARLLDLGKHEVEHFVYEKESKRSAYEKVNCQVRQSDRAGQSVKWDDGTPKGEDPCGVGQP